MTPGERARNRYNSHGTVTTSARDIVVCPRAQEGLAGFYPPGMETMSRKRGGCVCAWLSPPVRGARGIGRTPDEADETRVMGHETLGTAYPWISFLRVGLSSMRRGKYDEGVGLSGLGVVHGVVAASYAGGVERAERSSPAVKGRRRALLGWPTRAAIRSSVERRKKKGFEGEKGVSRELKDF